MKITDWLIPQQDEKSSRSGSPGQLMSTPNSGRGSTSHSSKGSSSSSKGSTPKNPSKTKGSTPKNQNSPKGSTQKTATPPKGSPKSNKHSSTNVSPTSKAKKQKISSEESLSAASTSSSSTKQGSNRSSNNSSSTVGGGSGNQGSSGTMTTVAGTHLTRVKQDVVLPQSKVKIIMKSSPEIEQVGQDVVYLITKATELFIDHLTSQTFIQANRSKNLEYKHLAEMTNDQENLEFLREIIPVKMSARDALKEIAKQKSLLSKELLMNE